LRSFDWTVRIRRAPQSISLVTLGQLIFQPSRAWTRLSCLQLRIFCRQKLLRSFTRKASKASSDCRRDNHSGRPDRQAIALGEPSVVHQSSSPCGWLKAFGIEGCLCSPAVATIFHVSATFFNSLPLFGPAAGSAIKKPLLECTITLFHTSTRHYSKRNKMPPKKQVVEEKILLGRPGNNLKSGIVGCLAGP